MTLLLIFYFMFVFAALMFAVLIFKVFYWFAVLIRDFVNEITQ